MSAVNIIVTDQGAVIFTDAAGYDGEGRLTHLLDKAWVAESAGLVVTGRGSAVLPKLVASFLDQGGWTIDLLEADGGRVLDRAFAAIEDRVQKRPGHDAYNDLWIVGWSGAEGRPKIVQWTSARYADVPRFSMVESAGAPALSPEGMARLRASMAKTGMAAGSIDYERACLELMKAQRLEVGEEKYGCGGQFLVGGHVQRTLVSAVGITKSIVHRWPEDRLGEKIRPLAELDPARSSSAAPPAGMSRAERRRLAKADRRAA